MSIWLQNDQHTHDAKLSTNLKEANNDATSSNYNSSNAYDDIMNYFTNSKEESIEIKNKNDNEKEECKKHGKKLRCKSLHRGPSEETFFIL